MVEDARYRTKDWLDTYITAGNLTKDDDATQVSYIVAYGFPTYPLPKVFIGKGVDLTFSVMDPTSTPKKGHDHYVIGYDERVPIITTCINKTGITGTKLRWKASAELRLVSETYPLGSLRNFDEESPYEKRLGSTVLYQQRFVLDYGRGTT